METFSPVIRQLEAQNIQYQLLQNHYDPNPKSPISLVVDQWKAKFIAHRTAPYLDYYLWHIFSYKATPALSGEAATKAYLTQKKARILIFNEPQQYLIACENALPLLEMNDFFDDLYIMPDQMQWTYVIPHEIPELGPYFSDTHFVGPSIKE